MNERKRQSEEIQNSGIEKIAGFLSKDGIAVSAGGNVEDLTSRGYGTLKNKKLTLSFYEALFLQSKELLEVYEEGS
ncbi:MAG: hypothetical protein JSW72_09215, partial [Candidatus Bathyarchaeota archaeon]